MDDKRSRAIGIGLVFGIAVGAAVGTATDNVGTWVGIGVAMGLALGAGFANQLKDGDDGKPDEPDAE